MAAGTYQLGYGRPITTNQTLAECPLMLDTRNGTLYYFQSEAAGTNGVRGKWMLCEATAEGSKNDRGIKYTPGSN
ncbi:MAG TPA: hypothetical protein VF669_06650 [Tepidisphaeraceae bacterium]|jgi:hypothetical protein